MILIARTVKGLMDDMVEMDFTVISRCQRNVLAPTQKMKLDNLKNILLLYKSPRRRGTTIQTE